MRRRLYDIGERAAPMLCGASSGDQLLPEDQPRPETDTRQLAPSMRRRDIVRRHLAGTAFFVLLVMTTWSCPARAGDAGQISAATLLEAIENDTAPAIIDVRSPREYDHGHVPGAALMPFQTVLAAASGLEVPKTEQVVVYCEKGPRATLAKAALQAAGFENVVYLEGHMSKWRESNLPQER